MPVTHVLAGDEEVWNFYQVLVDYLRISALVKYIHLTVYHIFKKVIAFFANLRYNIAQLKVRSE